jgi:pyruvate,water dikinase
VRSSAPEEDLASASFAGAYVTRLGVRSDALLPALRDGFASALAPRVLAYKREHGLDVRAPVMAAILQQQLMSDVAGVAFSLHPLTNDHDEITIDASFGLGEAVVSGRATPDHIVIDRVTRRVIERTLGAKQVRMVLDESGAIVEHTGDRARESALTETQLGALVDLLEHVERREGEPVDIEWAYAGGALHLLQARPITAYVPLPSEMMTKPGARRRLYADVALSKGMTMDAPISPFGLDWMGGMVGAYLESVGVVASDPERGIIFAAGGRVYANLSNLMRAGATPRRMAGQASYSDALAADILRNVDPALYRAEVRPAWMGPWLLVGLVKLAVSLRSTLARTVWVFVAPRRAHRGYTVALASFDDAVSTQLRDARPLEVFRDRLGEMLWRIVEITFPALAAAMVSPDIAIRRRSPEEHALAEKLQQGFVGNVTVEQGVQMYRVAHCLEAAEWRDLGTLVWRVRRREMPAAFLAAWDAFLERFGHRGPHEMDPASPRYADDRAPRRREEEALM